MSLPAAMVPPPVSLEDTLRERFGFDAFRPWQREAIEALLEGPRRVLVVAPTGGGKSLTYQLPAVVLEGSNTTAFHRARATTTRARALNAARARPRSALC